MNKRFRYYYWLTVAFIRRHRQTVIAAGLSAFILLLVGWRYSGRVRAMLVPDRQLIGMVGIYTPESLPKKVQEKISVGLTRVGPGQEVLSAVAEKWEVKEEGKVYIFHTRENLYWHDGVKFKAEDINYNFQDAEITPINSTTVKIELKEPFSPLPALLSKPLFREGLVGLGQYKVESIKRRGERMEEITLDPLDRTKDKPQMIKFYPTISDAVTAFKLGEIDFLETEQKPVELLSWEEKLNIERKLDTGRYVAVFFRTDKPPFDQKQFRQALANIIDDDLTDGNLRGPIPSNSWAYNEKLKTISYDPVKAIELFKKSGVATQSAEFTIHTFPDLLDTAHSLRSSWEDLGLATTVKVANSLPEDFSVLLTIQEIPKDPDQYPLWHSVQKATNITRYENPKIDKLLEDGRKTFLPEERKEIYDELQRYLMDELPAIYLYHPYIYTISRN